MNPLIKKELSKLNSNIEINTIDDNNILIPKLDTLPNVLDLNSTYIISVENYILNPPANFTLHANWNNNIKPISKTMMIEVDKIVGKMIHVHSVGYDLDKNEALTNVWDGWLPQASIKIIERI